MEETITVEDFIKIVRKRWKSIILLALIAGLIGWGITHYLLKPSYRASTQILANQQSSEPSADPLELRSNVDLINTYSVLIKSPIILEQVINSLNLNQTVEQLNQNITIDNHDYSFIFSITVEDPDAEMAVKITNAIAETFHREIQNILNTNNISILAKAELNRNVTLIVPNLNFNISIAVIVGIIAGIAIALLRDFLDNTLKDSDDVEVCLDLPVLGAVQELTQKQFKEDRVIYKGEGESVEV